MVIKSIDRIILVFITLFGVYTACQAQGKQYTDQSILNPVQAETLEERVNLFWQARVSGDLLTLYTLEAVSVMDQLTLRQYMNKSSQLIYKNANIIETTINNENEASAEVNAEVIVPGLKGTLNSQFKDQWIKINGQWYHRGRVQLPLAKTE